MDEQAPQIEHKGIIAWFARNTVAANLLMVLILGAGLLSGFSIKKQLFPKFESNRIQINIPYPGAAPEEVEKAVVLRVEEAIQDVKGIKETLSKATEGFAKITLEVASDYAIDEVLDLVQARVDAIAALPEQTEKPVVEKLAAQRGVLFVSIFGDLDARSRTVLAQEIREDIAALADVSSATIRGLKDYEISIEISEHTTQEYGITLAEVAAAIRKSSIDLPGGSIKTELGNILLRTKGQAYTGLDFGNVVLRSNRDGRRLLLRDIASIEDGFVESEGFSRFNGKPALTVAVFVSGEANVLDADKAVAHYVELKVEELQAKLADGVSLEIWGRGAYYLKGRLNMMLSNMAAGAFLVFLVLTLFLRIRVALWVIVGIPLSFLGALWFMPLTPLPVDINLLSLFAFILVLGIVVDDAIIIGESVYTEITQKGHTLDNVIAGANRVAMTATFGVLTTIAAFVPMLMVGGQVAPFFEAIGMVAILCLIFSLIESKLILPAHLAKMKFSLNKPVTPNLLERCQESIAQGLDRLIHHNYKRYLARAIDKRYTTVALFLSALILSIGLVGGGILKFKFFPDVPTDFLRVKIEMNNGSSALARNAVLTKLEQSILTLDEEYKAENQGQGFISYFIIYTQGELSGSATVELTKVEGRSIDVDEIEKRWRERVGDIAGLSQLRFFANDNSGGGAKINFQLYGNDYSQLEKATIALEASLRQYEGVYDIRNTYNRGGQEIQLKIKPQAQALGLSAEDLGRQVRQAFYGAEAQRIQRGRDELKVMVRYPKAQRQSIANLENMRIRTPEGDEVPFTEVAEATIGSGFTAIDRFNRKRSISVYADVHSDASPARTVTAEMMEKTIPQIRQNYPNVHVSLEGSSRHEIELFARIKIFFMVALFLIYGLLAIPLQSYSQPLIIMAVIPFGFIGAMIGHMIFGKVMSMMSLFGLVALAGVVINDSLIMVDFINRARSQGLGIEQAVVDAGCKRFRAILLTTLTTFLGLLPIMFETSLQAGFVIPMALSLSFGILFGTVITLFMIPALYIILEDLRNLVSRKKRLKLGIRS